jgi:hypothetical protein
MPATALPPGTSVRYVGSLEELRGRYGWIERLTPMGYEVALSAGAYDRVVHLLDVRRTSLIPSLRSHREG